MKGISFSQYCRCNPSGQKLHVASPSIADLRLLADTELPQILQDLPARVLSHVFAHSWAPRRGRPDKKHCVTKCQSMQMYELKCNNSQISIFSPQPSVHLHLKGIPGSIREFQMRNHNIVLEDMLYYLNILCRTQLPLFSHSI